MGETPDPKAAQADIAAKQAASQARLKLRQQGLSLANKRAAGPPQPAQDQPAPPEDPENGQ